MMNALLSSSGFPSKRRAIWFRAGLKAMLIRAHREEMQRRLEGTAK
jgi:hypothetical protein